MKTSPRFSSLALAAVLLGAAPFASGADSPLTQASFPAPSPKATLEQRVGTTDIKIEYYRPGVKGRKVFGGLEPYGVVWRAGANNPTKVTFSTDVKFGGTNVPAGSYGLYVIPGETEFSVILNKIGERDWGAYAYKQENDVVRVPAKVTKLNDVVETFTIDIGDLSANHSMAKLSLAWEKSRVSVPLEVDLSKFKTQLNEVMAGDYTKKPYFGAAMFTLEAGGDLKAAAAWMDEGLKANPAAFWMVYRKGLILEKMGDKAGAKVAAEASKKLVAEAATQPQSLKDEYTRLNDALLARVK